jgi:hypothetical protein
MVKFLLIGLGTGSKGPSLLPWSLDGSPLSLCCLLPTCTMILFLSYNARAISVEIWEKEILQDHWHALHLIFTSRPQQDNPNNMLLFFLRQQGRQGPFSSARLPSLISVLIHCRLCTNSLLSASRISIQRHMCSPNHHCPLPLSAMPPSICGPLLAGHLSFQRGCTHSQ